MSEDRLTAQVTQLTTQRAECATDAMDAQAEVAQLQQQVSALRAALEKYGRHKEGAGCRYGNGCFCGLDAALTPEAR